MEKYKDFNAPAFIREMSTINCRGYFRGKNIAYNETINLKRRTAL